MEGAGGQAYNGAAGRTRTEAVHVSCGCGVIFATEMVRSVNATRDKGVAARLLDGALNQAVCPSCGAASSGELPLVFHDEARRLFVLVLPLSMRHRELAERAALLLRVSEDTAHAVPPYVKELKVAFGIPALVRILADADSAAERDAANARRERELEERERALAGHAAELERHHKELAADVAALAEQRTALADREQELARRDQELDRRTAGLDLRESDLGQRGAELERRAGENERRAGENERRAGELDRREAQARRDADAVPREERRAAATEPHRPGLRGGAPTGFVRRGGEAFEPPPSRAEDGATGPFERLEEIEPEESMRSLIGGMLDGSPPAPRKHDPNATRVAPPPARDVAVERWILARAPTWKLLDGGRVRLLVTLAGDRLERLINGKLDVRVQLHRLPTYPLITVSVGRSEGDEDPVTFTHDLQRIEDRAVLAALAQEFHLVLDLYDPEYLPVVQRDVEAPLDGNVRHVLAQAEAHLAAIPPASRSYDVSVGAWRQPAYDKWGRRPHNLEEDSFSLLPTPGTARLALGIIAYWSEPENEDYLILVRSFPLEWWRRIRGRVLARAVDFGLALPVSLAEVAIAENHARSPRELAVRLGANFADVVSGLKPNDLEPEQVQENWRALVTACDQAGVKLEGRAADLAAVAVGAQPPAPVDTGARLRAAPRPLAATTPRAVSSFTQPLGSRAAGGAAQSFAAWVGGDAAHPVERTQQQRSPAPIVAGEIRPRTGSSPPRRDLRGTPDDELLRLLDDKDQRRDAALELCRRGEAGSVGPVFGAVRRMTRGEAVRVLPGVVGFGERAVPHLVDGLRSRKAYLRQGCALALGVLKSAEGIDPLCDLLIGEPTDVWREVARAIGEVGAGAVMSLAARLREQAREPVSTDKRERIAWAMAHIAARGHATPVETLASGRDPAAQAVAKRALELAATAKLNDAEVKGSQTPHDQTVNRAFSRRFFEAMGASGSAVAARAARAISGDTDEGELLDESELIDEDEELLDDEDLIPG